MPSWLTLKIGAYLLAGLAVFSFLLLANHWRTTMRDRGEKLQTICQATRAASGQPKLKCADVPKQVQFMGEAIGTLSSALDRQNAAVDALGKESERQKAEAAQAVLKAATRARGAEATSERLTASSRAGERLAKPCEPSKALTEAWQ